VKQKSGKTEIIEALFKARWNEKTHALADPIVTLADAQAAILEFNRAHPDQKQMSSRNPANFFKDFIRHQKRANANWPRSVWERGFTGEQLTSGGNCFKFVPRGGSEQPFPNQALEPKADAPRHRIESVSLPLASKRLGRNDEPWLIQVLIKLRVFETHLALTSEQKIVQLDHLQTNIKLSGSEIDALFLGIKKQDDLVQEVIICCEAKGLRDDIIPSQILGQVRAAFAMGIEQDVVIPMAVKAIAPSTIWLVEFNPINRAALASLTSLGIASYAIYELVPPVKGIGQ